MRSIIIFILAFFWTEYILPQGTAGVNAKYEYRTLVDLPTAGILDKGNVAVDFEAMPLGTVISRVETSPFKNFSIGVSYGAVNIIGDGSPKWYKLPGVAVRLRLFDEETNFPAALVGFDSQGKGEYYNNIINRNDTIPINRYKIKSRGFYCSVSKNYELLGFFSLHGVINYSLETEDDKDLNLSVGFEKTIGSQVSFVCEYDFAFNDNSPNSFGDGNGYLNFGFRWSAGDGFTIGLDVRDLLHNDRISLGSADRSFRVELVRPIF